MGGTPMPLQLRSTLGGELANLSPSPVAHRIPLWFRSGTAARPGFVTPARRRGPRDSGPLPFRSPQPFRPRLDPWHKPITPSAPKRRSPPRPATSASTGSTSSRELGIGNVDKLPFSIKVLLESCLRNLDNFQVTENGCEAAWPPGTRRRSTPSSCRSSRRASSSRISPACRRWWTWRRCARP